MSPLRGQDDQIQGVSRLDLDPGRPTPPDFVAEPSALIATPSCRRTTRPEGGLGLFRGLHQGSRDAYLFGHRRVERGPRRALVRRRSAPSMSRASKKNGLNDPERLSRRPTQGLLERQRHGPSTSTASGSPSSTAVRTGSPRAAATISDTCGDVVQARLNTATSVPSQYRWSRCRTASRPPTPAFSWRRKKASSIPALLPGRASVRVPCRRSDGTRPVLPRRQWARRGNCFQVAGQRRRFAHSRPAARRRVEQIASAGDRPPPLPDLAPAGATSSRCSSTITAPNRFMHGRRRAWRPAPPPAGRSPPALHAHSATDGVGGLVGRRRSRRAWRRPTPIWRFRTFAHQYGRAGLDLGAATRDPPSSATPAAGGLDLRPPHRHSRSRRPRSPPGRRTTPGRRAAGLTFLRRPRVRPVRWRRCSCRRRGSTSRSLTSNGPPQSWIEHEVTFSEQPSRTRCSRPAVGIHRDHRRSPPAVVRDVRVGVLDPLVLLDPVVRPRQPPRRPAPRARHP